MNKLTPLQRLGISHLLINYRFHGNQWFESGTITFQYNEHGKECELIDCTNTYYCCYKPEDLMFTIEDDNDKVIES